MTKIKATNNRAKSARRVGSWQIDGMDYGRVQFDQTRGFMDCKWYKL